MKLRSKKVFLREPTADDCDELIALYRSSRKHFAGYASSNYTRERFETLLEEAAKETNAAFVVCRVEDGAIVGTLNLSQIFRRLFQNAYIGYQLFAGHTGNGYMTEAVELALRHAFVTLKLHRIGASVQPWNKPSIAVLRRTGFTKEGYARRMLKINGKWRDHEQWAILKEDWVQRKRDERKGVGNSKQRTAKGRKSR